jgi:hypothetical protein
MRHLPANGSIVTVEVVSIFVGLKPTVPNSFAKLIEKLPA